MDKFPVCTYLLPFRRTAFRREEALELESYLQVLGAFGGEVLLVDGSPPSVFRKHHLRFDRLCRHVRVNRRFEYLNDKVNGIHTGVELASSNKIILADDDIRYTAAELKMMVKLLDEYE